MNPAYHMGKLAEQKGAVYFQNLGFEVCARNYRYQKAEVDLIVQKQNLLVAVEVKARSSIFYGSPASFVTPKKIRLLINAMNHYIRDKDLNVELRFDVLSYVVQGDMWHQTHLKAAFLPFT